MKNDNPPRINNYKSSGIEFIEITNNVGLTLTFTNLGAAIYSIKYDDKLMTYQAKNVEDFLREDVYNGKCLGRVSGRYPSETLIIDNKKFKLHANEGKTVLHGGKGGISSKVFSSRVFNTTEHIHVVYTYFSKAGEAGFPGNALFEVHYILSNNKAKLKTKLLSYVTAKCPISMSSHTFFSLGKDSLKGTKLTVHASKVLDMDPNTLLVKKAVKVPAYLDYSKGKEILKDIDHPELNKGMLKGVDHSYILDEVNEDKAQVTLENDQYKLDIYTDFDSVVVYTDNFDPHFEADNSKLKSRRGVAIEPQLDQSKDRYLSMHDEFSHFIRYEFSKK